MENIRNLTPHMVNVWDKNGQCWDIEPDGMVARCSQFEETVGELGTIKVTRQRFGEVIDLPPARVGTWLIVSRIVASALPERQDLLIPGPPVRDDNGKVIGCRGLSVL